MTKTQRVQVRTVKNLVAEGKEEEALLFKRVAMMNESRFWEAVQAGRKLRKESNEIS